MNIETRLNAFDSSGMSSLRYRVSSQVVAHAHVLPNTDRKIHNWSWRKVEIHLYHVLVLSTAVSIWPRACTPFIDCSVCDATFESELEHVLCLVCTSVIGRAVIIPTCSFHAQFVDQILYLQSILNVFFSTVIDDDNADNLRYFRISIRENDTFTIRCRIRLLKIPNADCKSL